MTNNHQSTETTDNAQWPNGGSLDLQSGGPRFKSCHKQMGHRLVVPVNR